MHSLATEQRECWGIGRVGGIPVRNLWLLMLYASDLFRQLGHGRVDVEENPEDIPDLIAEILAYAVERRLKRNLSFAYCARRAALNRVRGRIDVLATTRHQLMARGMVACRFDDFTVNTPRNRMVRAALDVIARVVRRPDLGRRCHALAASLKQAGVSGGRPSRTEMSTDRMGRHDSGDRFMLAAARLALDLALPLETKGEHCLAAPDRDIHWIRRLYEKAVAGFYTVVLSPQRWHVAAGRTLQWPVDDMTSGMDTILPSMRTDVVLDHLSDGRRIVIDTKFTDVLTRGWYRERTIRSGYVYQIYAYLRSQEGSVDPLAASAAGLLLHPAVGENVDETVVIQGHAIRFATVDLADAPSEIRAQLLRVVDDFTHFRSHTSP